MNILAPDGGTPWNRGMTQILVLGGTAWLGREVARRAVADGHAVTCLARGRAGDFPPGVTPVTADRDTPDAYAAVADGPWDVVIDVSWQPGQVRDAMAAVGPALADDGHWVYVSSGSVYVDRSEDLAGDESDPVQPPIDSDVAGAEDYSGAKVACEQAVRTLGEPRVCLARVGLIGGPGDASDRLGHWPAAFARAADDGQAAVLVPDVPDAVVQVIDVRDLAAFLLLAGRQRVAGPVDVVGAPTTFGAVVTGAREVAGHTGPVVPAAPGWLVEQGVGHWAGPRSLTLWLPEGHALSVPRPARAAVAAGLQRRSLADTLTDVLADERARGLERERRSGLTRAEEVLLLETLGAG